MASHFTTEQLDRLWAYFALLDQKLQAHEELYEPAFQSGPTKYNFYEMPIDFGVEQNIASWPRPLSWAWTTNAYCGHC